VQLRVSEPSWIEVHDAEGALLVSRILQPGEKLGLSGKLPIQLVIGNASATQLAFRGHPVDLAPSTRDNVAHVELQ
jgi:cytoskeleton protein RodZ